jgi:hypothetical protein
MRRKTILQLFTVSLISIGVLVGFYGAQTLHPFIFGIWTVFALTSAVFIQQTCKINRTDFAAKRHTRYRNSEFAKAEPNSAASELTLT